MPSLNSNPERDWILIGMAESCAARGYGATATEDICVAAGVSRASFDASFANKRECMGATMELIVEEGWRRLEKISSPSKPWEKELRDGVATLLRMLAERPDFARVALVEAQAAGGQAAALHRSAKSALVAQVERGRAVGEVETPASAARAAVAGAEALLLGSILAGKGDRLDQLTPEVVYLLAVPYVGRSAAQRLGSEAAERPALRAVA